VTIRDDAPTAVADVDSVTEDGPTVADGNVLTGLGGADGNTTDGAADTPGADQPGAITGVAAGTTPGAVSGGVDGAVAGAYGSLTLHADGSYCYALANAAQAEPRPLRGALPIYTFSYTLTDADGD